VETGEPGVKPPEPVIDVWRHQCLTHKVATSSCSVFLVNLCLLLVTNQVSSCKTGGIANQIIKPEFDMNAWIHRWGSSAFPFPCLRSLVGKFWCLHHDEIVSFVITPMLYWHGKPGLNPDSVQERNIGRAIGGNRCWGDERKSWAPRSSPG